MLMESEMWMVRFWSGGQMNDKNAMARKEVMLRLLNFIFSSS